MSHTFCHQAESRIPFADCRCRCSLLWALCRCTHKHTIRTGSRSRHVLYSTSLYPLCPRCTVVVGEEQTDIDVAITKNKALG